MGLSDKIAAKYNGKIREKALRNAKARIALSGVSLNDLNEEELEVIVQEEEDKVKRSLVNYSIAGLLIFLGIT